MTLLSFLKIFSLSQYDEMVGMLSPTEGGINFGPEPVQYFLTSYAQAKNIIQMVQDLCDNKEKQDKDNKNNSPDG